MKQLALKFSLLAPLDLLVETGRLARVLARHVPTEGLSVLEDVPALFAHKRSRERVHRYFWRCLSFSQ